MKTLRPIYEHARYSQPISKEIYKLLYTEIFKPLFDILDIKKYHFNSSSNSLKDALREGRLQYLDGFFIGPLTAALSKQLRGIGAVYNKTRKSYYLGRASLPQDIKLAIMAGNELANDQLDKVEDFLKSIEGKKITPPNIDPMFADVITGLDKQFNMTTKTVRASDIEIPLEPRLGDELKDAYTKNLEMYIQDWHDEQILRLRSQVHKNVAQGFRAENLVESIIAERGVSERKAEFLARQETSLMVSKYRQIRYEEVGIDKYIWSTSHDKRVRHDHRILDGKVFDFNNPPVTDQHTMARNNPGQDYNCRCLAIPVMSNRDVLERSMYKQEVNDNVPRRFAIT